MRTHNVFSELLRATLTKGLHCKFRAKGHSMSPFIEDGDVVTISPLNGSSLNIGDVVAFVNPETGKLAIYKVIGKKKGFYLIEGDNPSEAEGVVLKANTLGHVTEVEREGRKVFVSPGLERFLIAFLAHRGLLFVHVAPSKEASLLFPQANIV